MDRVFRVDLYPQDWLVLTGHMTPAQRGIFIQICCLIYAKRDRIDNDPAHIARVSNCSARLVRTVINELVSMGDLQFHGKKLGQKRCESELNKKRTHLESSANGGRKSAEIRRESIENNDIVSSDADGSLSTTSPSPYPIEKKDRESRAREKSPMIAPAGFDEFWDRFPKKRAGSRDKAMLAYRNALKRQPGEKINEAVIRYADSDEVARGFAKGAAAWLNDDRFLVEYQPPRSAPGVRPDAKQSNLERVILAGMRGEN